MAISNINPGVYSVSSTTVQPLAIINTTTTIPAGTPANMFPAQVGTTYYSEGSRSQLVQFNTVLANVGSGISQVANTNGSLFSLAGGNITYELTGTVTLTTGSIVDANSSPTVQWYNSTASQAIGPATPIGTPVTAVFTNTSANAVVVGLQVTQGGTRAQWKYPSQLIGASATLEQISGFQGS